MIITSFYHMQVDLCWGKYENLLKKQKWNKRAFPNNNYNNDNSNTDNKQIDSKKFKKAKIQENTRLEPVVTDLFQEESTREVTLSTNGLLTDISVPQGGKLVLGHKVIVVVFFLHLAAFFQLECSNSLNLI